MKTLLLVILAILIPPLAMLFTDGLGKHFWINLILWLLVVSWPIATVYALIIILKD